MQFHYIGGRWVEGNPPLITAYSHGTWMGTIVFDGARAFEGVTPDLDRHCAPPQLAACRVSAARVVRGRATAPSRARVRIARSSARWARWLPVAGLAAASRPM